MLPPDMLPNSSPAAVSAAPLNVFQRAKARLGIGNSRNETGPAPAAAPSLPEFSPGVLPAKAVNVLERAMARPRRENDPGPALEKTLFRAQKGKLQAAEAAAPGLPAATATAQALLDKFHGLKGGEKTAFFRAHKAELMAAEAAAPVRPATLRSASPVPASPAAARPEPSATDTPEALLEKFQGMTGAGKTAFFRANQSLLKAAAAVVSARESTGEAPAVRNFSAAQAAAPHRPLGAELLATFHTLSGTAKTAFFRANHLALKIAAAHETR